MNHCLETKRPLYKTMSRPASPLATRSDSPALLEIPPPAYDSDNKEYEPLLSKSELSSTSSSWVDIIAMIMMGCISFIGFMAIPLSTLLAPTTNSTPQTTTVVLEDAETIIKVNISVSDTISRKQQYEDLIAYRVFGALWMGVLVLHFVGAGKRCLKSSLDHGIKGSLFFGGFWVASFVMFLTWWYAFENLVEENFTTFLYQVLFTTTMSFPVQYFQKLCTSDKTVQERDLLVSLTVVWTHFVFLIPRFRDIMFKGHEWIFLDLQVLGCSVLLLGLLVWYFTKETNEEHVEGYTESDTDCELKGEKKWVVVVSGTSKDVVLDMKKGSQDLEKGEEMNVETSSGSKCDMIMNVVEGFIIGGLVLKLAFMFF